MITGVSSERNERYWVLKWLWHFVTMATMVNMLIIELFSLDDHREQTQTRVGEQLKNENVQMEIQWEIGELPWKSVPFLL